MPVIIKYAERVYSNKVSTLEGYINQLDGHLTTLKGYRDQLHTYWKDDEGRRYYELVNTEIRAVQNARTRAQSLRNIYDDAKQALNAQHGLAGGLLSEAESLLGNLGIGEK